MVLAVALAQLAADRVVGIGMSAVVVVAAGPPVVAARLAAAAAAVLVQQVAGVLVGCSYIPRVDCYRIVHICNAQIICGGNYSRGRVLCQLSDDLYTPLGYFTANQSRGRGRRPAGGAR